MLHNTCLSTIFALNLQEVVAFSFKRHQGTATDSVVIYCNKGSSSVVVSTSLGYLLENQPLSIEHTALQK